MKKVCMLIAVLSLVCSFKTNEIYLAMPYEKASVLENQKLLAFVAENSADTSNIYYLKPDNFFPTLGKLHALNKMHLYNENGYRLMLAPDEACSSPILSSAFDVTLATYAINTSDSLPAMLAGLEKLTAGNFDAEYPTAVLYWSRAIGLEKNDNVFIWEKGFKEKFNGKVNIIKVNMDVNSTWPQDYQEKALSITQKLLDRLNTPTTRKF